MAKEKVEAAKLEKEAKDSKKDSKKDRRKAKERKPVVEAVNPPLKPKDPTAFMSGRGKQAYNEAKERERIHATRQAKAAKDRLAAGK